ncbi:MAG TPA: glutathione S-transferase N-terminal domain-containing protein [Candidatus Acidoferrales bacterium]|nr:glutathione S-transferase N-terminal domain-containing protein [Candidatus Acidoferrales bacterium]
MIDQPIRIVGVPGSPYSRKLRAVLRYRRIPYAWINQGAPESRGLPQPRVQLLPQLILPGDDGKLEAHTDSTPLIRTLEERQTGRSVMPPDAALTLIDALIEDYADEWLTKAMFHYRWAFAADVAHAAAILPRWFRPNQPESEAVANGKMFSERQIERLRVVGSNEVTAALIEDSYVRLLHLLDAHLTDWRFLFGNRPASSDFGLFGQLTQLVGFDPTPAAIALQNAPRVVAWVDVVEDLSGLEPADDDWITRDAVPETLRALLGEIGRVYVPFLLANAAALDSGAPQVDCVIDGKRWTQRPFPYQGKCLRWLREAYAALAVDDQKAVDEMLTATGCSQLFN